MTDNSPAPLVLPNDPSDKAIVAQLARAISAGRAVVIWIDSPYRRIELHEYEAAGFDLDKMLRDATVKGYAAKQALIRWQRLKPINDDEKKTGLNHKTKTKTKRHDHIKNQRPRPEFLPRTEGCRKGKDAPTVAPEKTRMERSPDRGRDLRVCFPW